MRNAKICLIFACFISDINVKSYIFCIVVNKRATVCDLVFLEVTIRKIIQCRDEWTNRQRVITL